MKSMMPRPANRIEVATVLRVVADVYHVTPQQIQSPRRAAHIAIARHICMYLLREVCEWTLEEIGAAIGHRDHTTALHGVRRVTTGMQQDAGFARLVADLKTKCRPPTELAGGVA